MGYIRFLWSIIIIVLVLILSLPFMLIDLLIGIFSMPLRDKVTMKIVNVAFGIMLFATGTRVHISGLENIPSDKAVVYIGNHRSFFDVLVSYRLFPAPTLFIAKKEFSQVPILSWWMRLLHNLFLDRNDVKQGMKTILKAIDYVKEGKSVCIFPEGTRNRGGEDMLAFHEGSFKIADKTDCPIIPMTMYNMSAVFEDHFPKVTREDVYIDFGTPIIPSALAKEDRKHLGSYVREIMIQRYNELKENTQK